MVRRNLLAGVSAPALAHMTELGSCEKPYTPASCSSGSITAIT